MNFCPYCGRELKKPANSEYSLDSGASNNARSGNQRRLLLILGLVLFILVIIAIGLSIYISRNNDDTTVRNDIINESEGKDSSEAASAQKKTDVNPEGVDDKVSEIREQCDTIVSSIETGDYDETPLYEGVTEYCENQKIRALVAEKGAFGSNYTRRFYFDDDKLIFAYYEDKDSHRFYFDNNQLIRWKYCEDASDAQNAVDHDFEQTDEYKNWESTVKEASNYLMADPEFETCMEALKSAYIDYINSMDDADSYEYALIYISDDDYPELSIESLEPGGACKICTVYNGEVVSIGKRGNGYCYAEYGNVLSIGEWDDRFTDNFYSIEEGNFKVIASGSYASSIESGSTSLSDFIWNDNSVSESEYWEFSGAASSSCTYSYDSQYDEYTSKEGIIEKIRGL